MSEEAKPWGVGKFASKFLRFHVGRRGTKQVFKTGLVIEHSDHRRYIVMPSGAWRRLKPGMYEPQGGQDAAGN